MRRRRAARRVGGLSGLLLLLAGCGAEGEAPPPLGAAEGTASADATPASDASATGGDAADTLGADPSAAGQEAWFQTIVAAWQAERYAEALDQLLAYRERAPYGRNEVVDYLIATSACRAGQPDLGRALFESILYHYKLEEESRALVRAEQERCPPVQRYTPVALAVAPTGPVSAGTSGKLFYLLGLDSDEQVPLANQPVRVVREVPADSLRDRRFPPDRSDEAVASVTARLGKEWRVAAVGPFVLASRGHDEAGLLRMGEGLSAYLRFFEDDLGLQAPADLVTVYLAGSVGEMRDLALRLHGIEVAPQSIGYSVRDDLSMVGVIPGDVWGTLAHELFHLVVRHGFGDVPPWMDEGYAALYEVSRLQPDGTVRGLPNWRGRVLAETWGLRPSVEELVRADWSAFEAQGYELERQAANHATARYLALFLQERGLLGEVLRAFRDRDVPGIRGDPADDGVARVEAATGMSIGALDEAFAAWARALPVP